MADYLRAPPGWDEKQPNPFTSDGSYGPGWSCFRMLDADDDIIRNGTGDNGLYCFLAGRRTQDLDTRLADFLHYENAHGRKVILSFPPNITADEFIGRALENTPRVSRIRLHEPRWLVHSTSRAAWKRITACGELRSLARLTAEGTYARGVGESEFREPDDYAEYVMLCRYDHIAAEHVVASQAAGRTITEEYIPYEPGMRLYFDAHRIIRAGLAVRDGLHALKVHDHLPLYRYLAAAIDVGDVDPAGQVEVWTPKSFLESANGYFEEHCLRKLRQARRKPLIFALVFLLICIGYHLRFGDLRWPDNTDLNYISQQTGLSFPATATLEHGNMIDSGCRCEIIYIRAKVSFDRNKLDEFTKPLLATSGVTSRTDRLGIDDNINRRPECQGTSSPRREGIPYWWRPSSAHEFLAAKRDWTNVLVGLDDPRRVVVYINYTQKSQ